jgi:hypothetical protein
MKPIHKSALLMGFTAIVVSIPFVLLLWHPSDRPYDHILRTWLLLSPLLLGILTFFYFEILVFLLKGLWLRFSPILGALTGILTFMSFAIVYPLLLLPMPTPGEDYFQNLSVIAGMGFLIFGWVPIVLGGGAAWLGNKLFGP